MNNVTGNLNSQTESRPLKKEEDKRGSSPVIKSKYTEQLQDKETISNSTKKNFLQRGKGKLAVGNANPPNANNNNN